MIEFKNVHLNINNVEISNDISFKIEDNTVTSFLGSKNSGKTSILKMLSKIYKSYDGEVLIDDKDIRKDKTKKIGFLSDVEEKDYDITVTEFLHFYGELYNTMCKDELDSYIDTMLRKFSLISYKYTDICQLDKENYKFIDLIRVLIDDPEIILFDNLFFGDNSEYHEKMYSFIKTLIGKKTIIFASRNMNYLDGISDNIGLLDNGMLVAFDKKDSIYRFADVVSKIEVRVIGDADKAISLLKDNDKVLNISYDDNSIVLSLKSSDVFSFTKDIESEILAELINNGIKVYSYKRQQVRFEQLFEGIK